MKNWLYCEYYVLSENGILKDAVSVFKGFKY